MSGITEEWDEALLEEPFPLPMATLWIKNGWVYQRGGAFRRGILRLEGDRIGAVLPEDADTTPGEADARVVDAEGGYILPGFVDTHIHLTTLALKTLRCDLSGVRSASELCEVLAGYARRSDTPHVMGVGWDESQWTDRAHPTRAMLDAIDAERPILARRICGHMGVVNSALLKRLTPSPRLIDDVSGVVREHAVWEAGRLCEPDLAGLAQGIEIAIASLHRLGITAIHDIVEPAKFDDYLRGVKRSQAALRIDVLLHTDPGEFPKYADACGDMDPRSFRLVGVKLFLDGSLGGRTAAVNEPYADGGRGRLLMESDRLRAILKACHAGGYACAMHAIGDRAIDQALEGLADFPRGADNFRIEHCEIVGERQLAGLASRPVALSVQPNFMRQWGMPGGMYEECLGGDRLRSCNPLRTLREAGVPFVFGSDGMPPGPLYGIKGAAEHPVREERLGLADAIDRYTRWPNEIGLHRRDGGVLAAGRLADIVILDGNPVDEDADRLSVTRTLVGGQIVFAAETAPRGGTDRRSDLTKKG